MTVINSLSSFNDYFASLKALSCVFDTMIQSSALSPPLPNGQIALALQSIFDNPFSKQRKMTPPDFTGFSFALKCRQCNGDRSFVRSFVRSSAPERLLTPLQLMRVWSTTKPPTGSFLVDGWDR